ncbi:phosphatidate cytidylyltransferase, partial [bacterium]|nr:phosphatidate cytidylyltransferase [bacterium]
MTQELHNDSPGTDTGVEVGKGEIPHGGSRASLFARIPRVFEHYPGLLARLRTAGALVALSVVLLGGAELGGHYAWGLILFSYLLLVMTAYELVRACSSSPLHLSGLGTAASQTTFFFGLLFTPTVILLCRMSEGSFFEAFRIHAFLPVIGVAGGLSLFSVLLPIVFQSTVSLPVVERRILERVIAVLFVGIGGGAAMALVSAQEAAGLFFWFILVNALNDSGAYFIGARFQSSRLSPVLSPKKTLYGSYG